MSSRRSGPIAVLIALAAALLGWLGETALLSGWSIDHSLNMRHWLIGDRHDLDASPVIVLAVDEATFAHEAYRETPMALWGPQFARVLGALDNAGAAIIGMDIIPTTIAETVAPGHDRPFMAALQKLGKAGRLVLARADFADRSIAPHPAFAFMLGAENIRSINVPIDGDGITRHVPLRLGPSDQPSLSFAAEIARRAGAPPAALAAPDQHLVNFADIAVAPTYSLGEFTTCLDQGETEELKRQFGGRIVLLGAVLDVEDRKSVSARSFVDGAAGFRHLECASASPTPPPKYRTSLPGVFLHAQAINDLMRSDYLAPIGAGLGIILMIALAGLGGVIGWRMDWIEGGLLALGVTGVWLIAAGPWAMSERIVPVGGGAISATCGYLLVFGYRALLVEREKRRLAHALGRYLDEKVALKLLSEDQPLELGGELREVTVWFSDIAGFSTIAEGLAPKELVRRLNAHFTILGEAIEAEGGIIDKFVGDAVVAVFGAPQRLPDHAARAMRAASAAISRMQSSGSETGGFKVRIGINTGLALVGNVGSSRRFDYTVIGDAVNIAQRLEAANKEHGTTILVSRATVEAAGNAFSLQPVGPISVKGRAAKVEAFELLASGSANT